MPTSDLPRALYTVTETCSVLRPSVTPRKVHYWLHTGLLGVPARVEAQGRPTLLTFDQLTMIRVVQRLRDELGFSLPQVRRGVAWLLEELVKSEWQQLRFFRTGGGEIGIADESGNAFAIGGQATLVSVLPELNAFLSTARKEWEQGMLSITGYPMLVADARVMGGAPVIAGTRIETSFVAHVARELGPDRIETAFPLSPREALMQALRFEGERRAA